MTNPSRNPPSPSNPPNPLMIDLREATKKYDDGPPALAGVTLSVAAGECLAVLGHSGSGKSTLLNLIAGLDRPSSGTVTVNGTRVDRLGEAGSAKYRRASIGMIFQFFNLLDDLTVLDNVLVPAQLAGMGKAEAKRRSAELLGSLGIDRHAKAYPQRLSGGQRQRVAVARALMNRPALLLADEPTGALDSHSAEDVRRLLLDLNAEGQTILLVTHDVALAASTAHRTIELVDGAVARDVVNGAARGDASLTTPANAAVTGPAGAVR
ncbi:ABC transporter ATP-binding protein [Catenulispora pinistramenti]|uniref:ABC transporter ATP-binding protein n=1 Tax=Catenulispora pinistramenti TaxID=2705254 RepID=UPI001E32977C|nr:ABC transporter ATP-binding protein [Catenulispora pinistramenti]